MGKPNPELLATGIYRAGMVALVSGFAGASVEGLGPSTEGWPLVVAGIVIAIHGAAAPLVEYGLGWFNHDKVGLQTGDADE